MADAGSPTFAPNASRSSPSAWSRRCARRSCPARFRPARSCRPRSQLTETFGVSRTVIREAIATLAADGLVEPRQGAGVFVRDHPTLGLRLDQPRHRQQDLAGASTCSKCAWASKSKARVLRHSGTTARRKRVSRRPSSNSSGCSALDQATGKTDFAFHRAIAAATNNPFYVEVLDALGARTIPCDITSPWGTESVLTREYQDGLQREHLVDPQRDLRQRSAGGARCHARASHRQPGTLPPTPARSAGRISCRRRQAAGLALSTSHLESRFMTQAISTTRPASPSIPRRRRPWATDELRRHFHIADLFQPRTDQPHLHPLRPHDRRRRHAGRRGA